MKKGPGRPRTTPIDPNWNDLKAIETELFSKINPKADLDEFEAKIGAVRAAREADDQGEYATALRDLIQFDYDSYDVSDEYDPTALDNLIKQDRFLDTRGLAKVRGFFHGKARDGSTPIGIRQELDDAVTKYRNTRPDISQIRSALGSDWDVEGAKAFADRLESELTAEYARQGAHQAEADFRARRKTLKTLQDFTNNPAKSHLRLTSDRNNAEIKLYMKTDGADGTLTPVIDSADVSRIRDGISAARNFRFNKEKITVNVLDNNSEAAPKAITNQIGDKEVAFTFLNGDGIYIYPQKVDSLVSDISRDPNWFSTDVTDRDSAYKHLIVHESAHLQMYKLWGDENSSGRKALEDDFKNFNVSKDGTSLYGDESFSESFAEQYAKYLLTGNASDEFMELLSSKGLTRAQLNKKWRSNVPQLSNSKFFNFLDGILADDQQGQIPEFSGPEASEYNSDGKYGAARVHKIARILGFTSSKPTTVDSLTEDRYIIYRGVNPVKDQSGWELHNMFRTADMPWYGYGVHGDGQYASTDSGTARSFGDVVAKMRVKPDAKVYTETRGISQGLFDPATSNDGIDLLQLHGQMFGTGGLLEQIVINEIDPELEGIELYREASLLGTKMGLKGSYEYDKSILAGILGFQGIEVKMSGVESYFVVLDRSMLEMLVPPGFED